jgi:hypothetical protein
MKGGNVGKMQRKKPLTRDYSTMKIEGEKTVEADGIVRMGQV